MLVHNSWGTQGKETAAFITVHKCIDEQLNGTSVTVVLIEWETINWLFVKYEIYESLDKGNGVVGVYIHNIRDMIT